MPAIDRRQGRWPESARNLERALELDPNNVFILQQISSSYECLREYPKDVVVVDRVLKLKPNDLDARISRAMLEVFWKTNPQPLHELVESITRQNITSAANLAPIRIFLTLAERNVEAGVEAIANLGDTTFGPDAIQYGRAYMEGVFAQLKGDRPAAQASFLRARTEQQQIVNAQPDYGPALCVLGLIDAGLGRKDDAVREGRRAVGVMPLNKDSINGAHIMDLLAVIYAWVGEKDLAVDQLSRTVQLPGGPQYGVLRLFPQWDPLRGDPRFEKIVQSLASKS